MYCAARYVPSWKVPAVAAAVLVLLGGCDFLFPPFEPTQPSFRMAGNLDARTATLSGASNRPTSAGTSAASALSLTPIIQVQSPTVETTRTQASHLSYDPETRRLLVGYKLAGTEWGGGMDLLKVQPQATGRGIVEGQRSLKSENMDVVEVRYAPNDGALYAAGAVTTDKAEVSPAVVSRVVSSDSAVEARSKRLAHNVAKSVVRGPETTVHVTTDENALFQLNAGLEDRSKLTRDDADGFRSAAVYGERVFVLDQSGRLFRANVKSFQELSPVVRLGESDFGGGAVARLHATDGHLYASLNENGFALLNSLGTATWKSDPVPVPARYTCVAVGPDYLYAGRFDGVIEVYRRPKTIPNKQLKKMGTFGPWGSEYGGRLTGAPINQIEVVEDHLFVANSRDGMVVFRVDEE